MALATTREIESNPPHFGARYYSSGSSLTGRFLSPDWAARPTAVPYAVFGDPQSLNLYGYVRDDPVSRADADGHDSCTNAGDNCASKQTQRRDSALSNSSTQKSSAQKQIKQYIIDEAKAYGVPVNIALATVQQESSFNPSEVNENKNKKGVLTSTDYGLMQINDKYVFNKTVTGPDGKKFTVNGSKVKTDWKYNVAVGMALLKGAYTFASAHAPNDAAAATYAYYNSPLHWNQYNSPGTAVYRHVQLFLGKYNALGGGP